VKFAPAVAALAERARSGAPLTAEDARIVSRGQAYLRLTVTNYSPQSLALLRAAGFTILRQDRGDVEGRVAPAKLDALAQLPFVMWIAPR
jgi:hypothetical protein